jgi:hypothetical protein
MEVMVEVPLHLLIELVKVQQLILVEAVVELVLVDLVLLLVEQVALV